MSKLSPAKPPECGSSVDKVGTSMQLAAQPPSCTSPMQALQRAEGEAHVAFKASGGRTMLADLYQSGSARMRIPRTPGMEMEAVFINTAGGLTDGDRFTVQARWQEGSTATVTTQACERIYKSRGGAALVSNELHVADGAFASWLPQETILFDGGRLRREARVHLEGSARLLALEAVIVGRPAMGETVRSGSLLDGWRIERDGKLIFADRLGLEGDIATELDRLGTGGGAGAFATLIYTGADSEAKYAQLCRLPQEGATAFACSDLGGIILARVLAHDGQGLRKMLKTVLEAFRGRSNLPRLWTY